MLGCVFILFPPLDMHTFSRPLALALVGSMLVPLMAMADDSSSSSSQSSSSSSSISSSSVSSGSSSVYSRSSSARSDREGSKGRRKTLQPIVSGCIQTAVDARETAVLSSLTAYTNSIVAAFQTKKSGLHDAWSIGDASQRKASIKTVWTTFAQSKKGARKTYQTARQSAWENFKKSSKTCRESMSDEMYKANEDL